MKFKPNIINKRDLGIELLRVVLCFWIVLVHCLSPSFLTIIIYKYNYHVPCFIFISFYFFYTTLSKRDINRIKNRFIRLLIPFWTWPIIIWIFNNICFYYFSKNRFNRFLSYNDLKIQLLLGRRFYRQLWFLFNLLLFTLAFLIISFILKKNFLFLFQILAIMIYILQYSGITIKLFHNYKDCIECSIGHCFATYPISIIALTFSSMKAIPTLKFNTFKIIFLSTMLMYLIFKYDIFLDINYGYYGFKKAIFAFLAFIIFGSLSIEKCKNEMLKIIIKRITQYTQGIFCLHYIVRFYFLKIFQIKKSGINECIIIYLISYFISFIGSNCLSSTKFRYLFE